MKAIEAKPRFFLPVSANPADMARSPEKATSMAPVEIFQRGRRPTRSVRLAPIRAAIKLKIWRPTLRPVCWTELVIPARMRTGAK